MLYKRIMRHKYFPEVIILHNWMGSFLRGASIRCVVQRIPRLLMEPKNSLPYLQEAGHWMLT
jgi:hypothetical protein